MSVMLFVAHLLGFVAPALGMAALLWLALQARHATRLGRGGRFAVLLAGGVVVLVAGLVVLGRDGRMATYAALVLVQGSLAWWLRGR